MTTPKNKGNDHARKGAESATAQIQMRVTPSRKNLYVKQAQDEGLKLTEWAIKHLDAACADSGDIDCIDNQ